MFKRLLIGAAALFAFVGAGAFGFSPDASASTQGIAPAVRSVAQEDGNFPLRKRDYVRYCQSEGYWEVDAQGSRAYFLRCIGNGDSMEITITNVCTWKYGDSFISRLRTMDRNPYRRWGCISDNYAGPITWKNMQRQCLRQKGNLYSVERGYPAYQWRCNPGEGLNMTALCDKIYGRYGRNTIDRIYDLYDKDSWGCYYTRNY